MLPDVLRVKPNLSVLVACPCYPHDPGVYPRAREAIEVLAHRGQVEVLYLRQPRGLESGYANITANYEEARRIALHRGVDALLCVEADIIPPADALARLASADADVAYGLYVWRGQRLWSAYTSVAENGGASVSADPEQARRDWGRVIDVEGVGLGCTLIRRRVLEATHFRLPEGEPDGVCCDWTFALDCKRLGFTQRAHLGVVCGHLMHDHVGKALWPDSTAESLYRVN